jgi:hypothetical protein
MLVVGIKNLISVLYLQQTLVLQIKTVSTTNFLERAPLAGLKARIVTIRERYMYRDVLKIILFLHIAPISIEKENHLLFSTAVSYTPLYYHEFGFISAQAWRT